MASLYEVLTQLQTMKDDISHAEAQAIAESWKRTVLNDDFERRIAGKEQAGTADRYANQLAETHRRIKEAAFTLPPEAEQHVAERHGFDLLPDSQAARRLGYYVLKARIEYLEELQRRSCPETPHLMSYFDEPRQAMPAVAVPSYAPAPAPTAQEDTRLSVMFEQWKAESQRSPRTNQDWWTVVRRFTEIKGDKPVAEITKADVRDFKTACMQIPRCRKHGTISLPLPELVARFKGREVQRLTPRTVNKMLAGLGAILSWCVANGYIETNPAKGMRVPNPKVVGQRRLPFTAEDLKAIFEDSPVYKDGKRYRGGGGEAAYWIPILALYTGMRLEEIGQLHIEDVKQEGEIWYLDVNTLHEDKAVKTMSSIRKVPLHTAVLNLGFIPYVKKMQRQGHRHVFPHLTPKGEKRTGNFSKWVNRYISEKCGISDPRKVFHSFRHTFKDACREAGIARELHDRITGHSLGNIGDTYGVGPGLEYIHKAMDKLYPKR